MKTLIQALATTTVLAATASSGHAGVTISVPDVQFSHQNLVVSSLGATSATTVSFLNYVVGPSGVASTWERPIIPFPRTSFASIAGMPLVSATLHYSITGDFTENRRELHLRGATLLDQ